MNESRSQILTQNIRRDPHSPLSRPITPSKLTKILRNEKSFELNMNCLEQENASLNVPEGFETRQMIPRTPLEVTKEDFYGNSKISQFDANDYGVSRKPGSQQQRLQDYTNQPSYFDRQPDNNSRRQSKRDENNTSHRKESMHDFENRPVVTHLTEKQQQPVDEEVTIYILRIEFF